MSCHEIQRKKNNEVYTSPTLPISSLTTLCVISKYLIHLETEELTK